MTSFLEDEFTELVNADFPRVDLVGKAANGVHRFLIAKGAAGDSAQGVIEASVIRDLVAKAEQKETPVTSVAVEKADGEVTVGSDLNADETFVGDPNTVTQPGSPEWEQVDADTAAKWVGILARAKNAVDALANRERAEVFAETGDPSDVWSLEDACCALDAALSALAPYAVSEAAEAATGAEEGVFKAASLLFEDPFPLATIEGFNAVLNSGRGLSSEVAKQYHGAVTDLGKILSNLPTPEAPMTDVQKEAGAPTTPVAGTTQADMVSGVHGQDSPNANSEQHPANEGDAVSPEERHLEGDPGIDTDAHNMGGVSTPAPGTVQATLGDNGQTSPNANPQQGPIRKASGPQQAVYDSQGNLLGTVDPTKITELIAEGSGDATATVEAGDAAEAPTGEDVPVEAAAAAPAPAAPSGDETSGAAAPAAVAAPAPAETSDDKVEKSEIADVVKAALAKTLAENAEVVKALEDRIAHLEAPAKSRVLSHGAVPDARLLRGQDKATDASVDVAKASDLRERLDSATDIDARSAVEKEMNEAANAEWARLRSGQPGGLGSVIR